MFIEPLCRICIVEYEMHGNERKRTVIKPDDKSFEKAVLGKEDSLANDFKAVQIERKYMQGGGGSDRPLHRHIGGNSAACQGTGQPIRHPVGEADSQLDVDYQGFLPAQTPAQFG